MSILGNDLANTIQSDRREHAERERLARSVRIERQSAATSHTRLSTAQRLRFKMPNWARLALAWPR